MTGLQTDESGIISGVQGFCSSGLTVFVTQPLNLITFTITVLYFAVLYFTVQGKVPI